MLMNDIYFGYLTRNMAFHAEICIKSHKNGQYLLLVVTNINRCIKNSCHTKTQILSKQGSICFFKKSSYLLPLMNLLLLRSQFAFLKTMSAVFAFFKNESLCISRSKKIIALLAQYFPF